MGTWSGKKTSNHSSNRFDQFLDRFDRLSGIYRTSKFIRTVSLFLSLSLSLSHMHTQAGKEGKTTVFLLTDTQIKQESFLEDVDGLLNAGEVPNLFAIDEKQEIVEVSIYNYIIITS